jgi:hypothetical protein
VDGCIGGMGKRKGDMKNGKGLEGGMGKTKGDLKEVV